MEDCTVQELKSMVFDKTIRPRKFFDGASEIPVNDWTDLALEFVNWLIRKGYLTKEKLPVPNYANRGKYFINSTPQHKYPEKDAFWHHIGEYHIDTKYNAQSHINNIISTLDHLGVYGPKIKITFRKY